MAKYTLDTFPFAPGETIQVRTANGNEQDMDVPRMPMQREHFLHLVAMGDYTIVTPVPSQETGEDESGQGEPDDVPSGTIDEVLAWVGTDAERASQALIIEQASKNRVSLVARLNEILDSADGES